MTEVADRVGRRRPPRPRPARTRAPGPHLPARRGARRARSPPREPDWLRRRPPRARSRRYEALPVEPNRLYTPYVDLRAADLGGRRRVRRAAAAAAAPAAGARPTGIAALAAFDEDGVASIVAHRRGARGPASPWRRSPSFVRAIPRPPARLLAGRRRLPADDKLAQLSRAAWSQGVVVRVPAGVRLDAADRRPLGGRRAGPRARTPGRSSSSARAPRRRSSRSSSPSDGAVRRRPGAVHRHDRDPPRAPAPGSRWRASRSSARTRSCSSSATPTIGEGARPPLGARAARRPARPLARRQRARGRPQHGRAGRDRVRLGRPAARPDLVHAPRRPRHDGPAAVARACCWTRRAATSRA